MDRNRRRYFALLATDTVFFFITMSVAGYDNVLPLFAAGLTSSTPLIGLVTAIALGLWVVPQLLLAGYVQRQPDKWQVMAWSLCGRLAMPVIAVACFSPLAAQPQRLLTVFLVLYSIYTLSDGVIVLALSDMLPRLLPERDRVRLFSLTQVITGVLGLFAGAIVSWVLGNSRWPYPHNYGVLLWIASGALLVSAVALLLLPRERHPVSGTPLSTAYAQVWRDPRFRRMVAVQVLSSCVWLAVPYYGVHATTQLGLTDQIAGLFVIVSSLTYIAASLVLGMIGQHKGVHAIIRYGAVVVVTSPLIALAAEIWGGASPLVYALVYVGIGVLNSLRMLGFRNYVFALAPEGARPTYVGLANGLVGVTGLMPVLGGWLLSATSYRLVFALAAACAAAGAVLALSLPQATAQDEPTSAD